MEYVYSGIKFQNNEYLADYEHNDMYDIIHTCTPQIYQSNKAGNIYWFEYTFNDGGQYTTKDYPNPEDSQIAKIHKILDNIHSQYYFSIAQNVPKKYRQYIQNYLNFKSEECEKSFQSLTNANILIVDDINTSGSTIDEILRIINKVNSDCTIFVYTLIGRL